MIPKPHRRLNVAFPVDGVLKHMAVHEWGHARNPRVAVCVHGLSRNGRDFDLLADALASNHRVLCPDVPGRGESDWFASADHYTIPHYIQAMNAMLTEFSVQTYDWVGTSMGGLIGMVMASSTLIAPSSKMRRFVINDNGVLPTYPAIRSSEARSMTGPMSLITKRRIFELGAINEDEVIIIPIRPPIEVPTQSYVCTLITTRFLITFRR